MIVLDDLHRLVEYVKVGSQITVSHELLHTVTTLLTGTVPAGMCTHSQCVVKRREERMYRDQRFVKMRKRGRPIRPLSLLPVRIYLVNP